MNYLALKLPLFAQAAGKASETAAEEPSLLSPWMTFFLIILLLGLPFVLGTLFARLLKMKDLARKISVVLLVLELGLAPFVAQYVIGALEQRQYDRQLAEWKQKQAARDQITSEHIGELKDAVPTVNILGGPEPPEPSGDADTDTKQKPKKKPADKKTTNKTTTKKTTTKSKAETNNQKQQNDEDGKANTKKAKAGD